jgi:radical SAM superfamily enzyme YgiQ (UPF0313 family)
MSSANTKVVVASVPFTDTTAPIMAPAALKGVLDNAGVDCVGIDLNGTIFEKIHNDADYSKYLQFFYHEAVSAGFESKIKSLFDYMATEILQYNPTIVCLSLLHYQCQVSATWLSFCIKKINPTIKIVIGGPGAFGSGYLTNDNTYTSKLKEQGVIDHFISGDGDIALVEFVRGNVNYPGVDSMSWNPIENLDSIPYPNYNDYDFSIYKSPFIGILGSRGCVRQCTFCDIHEYWEKFKWRTAQNIFDEILAQNKRYGIRYFKFQDSLINGNVKEYSTLITLLADHNKKNSENSLSWASYFIFRQESQMSEEMWQLTAKSGAINLNIGIESLVEKNRDHIKKKFSNADIQYGLEMAKKYNVKLTFLLLVGYVTETEQDHLETIEWLEKNKHFANNPINTITFGGTLAILPGTWLHRNQKKLGVIWKEGSAAKNSGVNQLWEIKATGNNYETRLRRLNNLIQLGRACGFNVNHSVVDPQKELEDVIKEKMHNVNEPV